jgi:hypothetical protein
MLPHSPPPTQPLPATPSADPQVILQPAAQSPPANSDAHQQQSTVPPEEQAILRRLGLRDDDTFATRASDAVSRATGADNATNGADSFRSSNTTDIRRSYKEKCLEIAKLKAELAAQSIDDKDDGSISSDNESTTSQGSPTSKGSAAATPKAKATSAADLPDVNRGGGANA